ncbi:hypothetical protein [Paremcibacter congregatus]|uniref:Uncharacterized protein n=1 Tax=Paremcibacter congregatus TaxID=2043170 RepID=A0A2G4YM86_9PROT|nr:hypothetical protein [Paremcibacter congregatus]PHZ83422.1 hypothetical protein CRD36_17855 [Paremcibacter congregatus]QDE28110.1 hypothetical protein FIV45_12950 [Paremcibacter congregatus]
MRHFQKIIFAVAVIMLGFSIWYYADVTTPPPAPAPVIVSPIQEDEVPTAGAEFDVRDYGVSEKEAPAMNAYFAEVKAEVTDVLNRDETVVVTMNDFKTRDAYKQKLYMALSMANRLKVVSATACDRLKKKLDETKSADQQEKIRRSSEYVVCFPAKW